jgi:hypothetical protein
MIFFGIFTDDFEKGIKKPDDSRIAESSGDLIGGDAKRRYDHSSP